MQITVKILGGQECTIEVTSSMLIEDVKKELSIKMNIPVESQKLVFKGKTMLDASKIGEHTLEEGAKVHLVVNKSVTGTTASPSLPSDTSFANTSARSAGAGHDFWKILEELLKRHFSPGDAAKVILEYKKDFEAGLQSLNLDDIDRLSRAILEWRDDKQTLGVNLEPVGTVKTETGQNLTL